MFNQLRSLKFFHMKMISSVTLTFWAYRGQCLLPLRYKSLPLILRHFTFLHFYYSILIAITKIKYAKKNVLKATLIVNLIIGTNKVIKVRIVLAFKTIKDVISHLVFRFLNMYSHKWNCFIGQMLFYYALGSHILS